MKKFLSIILVVILAFSIISCEGKKDKSKNSEPVKLSEEEIENNEFIKVGELALMVTNEYIDEEITPSVAQEQLGILYDRAKKELDKDENNTDGLMIYDDIGMLETFVNSLSGTSYYVLEYEHVLEYKQKLEQHIDELRVRLGGSKKATTSSEEITTSYTTTTPMETTTKRITTTTKKLLAAKNVKTKAYFFSNSFRDYVALVLTNKTGYNIEITVDLDFLDDNGNIVGTQSKTEDAFEKGQSIVMIFDNDIEFTKVDYNKIVDYDTYNECVQSDLDCDVSIIENKAIISATNTGSIDAEDVKYTALFFDGKYVVDYATGYLEDSNYLLESGDTQKDEAKCYDDFDKVKVWLTGRGASLY